MKACASLRRLLIACLFAALVLVPLCGMEPGASAASQVKETGSAGSSASRGVGTATGKIQKQRGRKRSWRRKRRQGQLRPTPSRITEIQAALIQKDYLKGEPTGVWDAETTNAMQRFQQASGLEPTGRLDARSLIKLGLGPETAGVGAPRPPAVQPSPSPPSGPSNPSSPPR